MAQVPKKYEAVVAPFFKNGVTLDFYTITFPSADLTDNLAADTANYSGNAARSPVAVALEAVQARASIEIIGTPRFSGGNTTLTIAVAALGGGYPTDNYDGASGTESFAAYLQSLIVAASPSNYTYQGFDLTNATVAANVRGVAL